MFGRKYGKWQLLTLCDGWKFSRPNLVSGRLVAWRYFSGTGVSATLVKPQLGVAREIRADKVTAEHRSG